MSWTLLSTPSVDIMERRPKERDGGFEGQQAALFYMK